MKVFRYRHSQSCCALLPQFPAYFKIPLCVIGSSVDSKTHGSGTCNEPLVWGALCQHESEGTQGMAG